MNVFPSIRQFFALPKPTPLVKPIGRSLVTPIAVQTNDT